jgi:hypothetical protein
MNSSKKSRPMPPSGFGALSRRNGRKPIIAAVNGLAYGGGTELIVNCDMVVAAKSASFGLPEVKRGVIALAGALPRITRTIGRPRAAEMALTGRVVPAQEAYEWGLINKVVGDGEGEVVAAAVEYAKMIAENSPDAVIVSREGIKMGWEGVGAEEGSRLLAENWYPRLRRLWRRGSRFGSRRNCRRTAVGMYQTETLLRTHIFLAWFSVSSNDEQNCRQWEVGGGMAPSTHWWGFSAVYNRTSA